MLARYGNQPGGLTSAYLEDNSVLIVISEVQDLTNLTVEGA
jgi:hypothetical protein